MNETRKAIIELIEPYMGKTLSFGCYIIHENYMCTFLNKTDFGDYRVIKNLGIISFDIVIKKDGELKILGHYDITAVLKYIDSKGYNIHNEQNNGVIYVYKSDGFDNPYLGIIQFKPLHLYTEQEELQLLDLLTK